MSPHGEGAYKYLIYLNDAYKRAIIESWESTVLVSFVALQNTVGLLDLWNLYICLLLCDILDLTFDLRPVMVFVLFSFIFEMRSMLVAKLREITSCKTQYLVSYFM